MKLSIITVNLNNRDGLRKTIDSVVAQTFRDFEWIVIDGGSTDGSRELIEQYADHFAYWVSEPDKGIYNAMNKGIRVAKGEYLQFLNSGDWLCDETALERCFSHHFTADIAYGDFYYCDGNEMGLINLPERLSFRDLYRNTICHQSCFYKRHVLQEEPYNENLKIVSDWETYVKQALRNGTFKHIGECVSVCELGGISTVKENEDDLVRERKKVIEEQLSPLFVIDYERMDEMEELLNKNHVRKVLEYGGKNKLYHKMISAFLVFIDTIDRISCKKSRE